MRSRCERPDFDAYPWYGGRGIKVCERWRSFDNFFADMRAAPMGMTLDRINNDGDYEPGNCRWVSAKSNCRNRSSNVLLTRDGKTKTVIEWSEILGVDPFRVYARLRRGWSAEKALDKKAYRAPNRPKNDPA